MDEYLLNIEMNKKQFCDHCKQPYFYNEVELEKFVEMTIVQEDGSVVCPVCCTVRTVKEIKQAAILRIEKSENDL